MIVSDTADREAGREERIPVDLNQPIVLEVHNPNGDVTVRATDRTDVLVGHTTPGFSGAPGDDETGLTIDTRNNRIEVRVNPHPGTGWTAVAGEVDLDAVFGQITRAFRRGGPWATAKAGKGRVAVGGHVWSDITIEVPQAITGRIGIHSASGDVRIEGLTGEIALNTMSGDVRVARTTGDLVIQTASGDLAIEGATGRLSAQTASGDVNVTSVRSEAFDIQTAAGDILLDAMPTGDGPFRVRTASGDVHLTLRRSTAGGEEPVATLAFHTVSGDAHVAEPFRKTGRRLWQVGAGDSGPRIDITTVSGDLVARFVAAESAFTSSISTPPTPPAPPAQPASPTEPAPVTVAWPRDEVDVAATAARPEAAPSPGQEDAMRHAVLAAVERGEIDVEEALRRLEAADSMPSS
jgi:hypothetical protein